MTDTSPVADWPPLPGVDIPSALARCGDNAALLRKLLGRFVGDALPFDERFMAILPTDRDAARRMAHTLKGTAANLGLAGVSALASALEKSVEEGADDAAIAPHLERLEAVRQMQFVLVRRWLDALPP